MNKKMPQPSGKEGAPWRKEMPQKFKDQVAAKAPFQVKPLIEYLSAGNAAIRTTVSEKALQPSQVEGKRPGHEFMFIQCSDSRHATIRPHMLLDYGVMHQRAAGSLVGDGSRLGAVSPDGCVVVEGHRTCGACKAASDYEHAAKSAGQGHTFAINPAIQSIILSIPEYVRGISDSEVRDPENAIAQASQARRALIAKYRRPSPYVLSMFYDWTSGHRWLGGLTGWDAREDSISKQLGKDANKMTDYALAENRDFSTQYAALTMLYDPFRLGRFNDPRAVFGALGNEMFCVTADFSPFMSGVTVAEERRMAPTAIGSVLYAGYDNAGGYQGHVSGVGGMGGTHILGIMDTSREVIEGVKLHLLEKFPVIKDLAKNGERILKILYNPGTAEATFIR